MLLTKDEVKSVKVVILFFFSSFFKLHNKTRSSQNQATKLQTLYIFQLNKFSS